MKEENEIITDNNEIMSAIRNRKLEMIEINENENLNNEISKCWRRNDNGSENENEENVNKHGRKSWYERRNNKILKEMKKATAAWNININERKNEEIL